jgi:hypothetical protein
VLRANGKSYRFHDPRHTAASFLLAQGVPLRVVMEILGHSPIGLTADTYGHIAPEVQRAAADRMEELLRQLDDQDGGEGTDEVSDGVSEADGCGEVPAGEGGDSAE